MKYWNDFGYYRYAGNPLCPEAIDIGMDDNEFQSQHIIDKAMKDLENLYKRCDVKILKEKIWDVLNENIVLF